MVRMTAVMDPMSPKIVQPSLVLPVNFNAIILIAFFLLKFVMEAMTALMDQTSSSAMTTHVCQSNLSALDDFTKMALLHKDFVFQWKNGVIGRLIVQMAKTRMPVCL